MNPSLLCVLAGQAVWPSPIWRMHQAGRDLHGYRKLRAKAGGFIDLCLNPATATEAPAEHMVQLREFIRRA